MRCLVLVMCCNQDFFLREEKKVRETWAKDILNKKYPNLDYFMYTASDKSYIDYENKIIYVNADDTLMGTFEKTSKCFQLIKDNGILNEFDFILRTNASTYINVSLLNALLESDRIDRNLIYGGDIYCSQSYCGPYNYSYYAVGNSILISTHYLSLITEENKQKYLKYYNVIPDHRECLSIDDNAIGFILNCYFEFDVKIYHKQMYRVLGNNHKVEDVNKFIFTPIRIYNGDRENEFRLYDMLHSQYNHSTDLSIPLKLSYPLYNYYKMFI